VGTLVLPFRATLPPRWKAEIPEISEIQVHPDAFRDRYGLLDGARMC